MMVPNLVDAIVASAEDADAARRLALRRALRGWRSSIDPREVDLPVRTRRRPGLTREDVAELAGLSLCWYTMLESASPRHRCSPRAIDRVADALRLNPECRAFLQVLSSPEVFRSVRLIVRTLQRAPGT